MCTALTSVEVWLNNYAYLYMQVRLTENKLDIVRNVLDSSPSAYRDYEKVTIYFIMHTCMKALLYWSLGCYCMRDIMHSYLQITRLSRLLEGAGSAEEESLMERKLIPSEGHSLILIILAALQVTVVHF